MSSPKNPQDPAALKKRGRPKKVAGEAGTTPAADSSKAAGKDKFAEFKKLEKMMAKPVTSTPVANKDAPQQPTPATPATSKILDEVRTKGTLKPVSPPTEARTSSGTGTGTGSSNAEQRKPNSIQHTTTTQKTPPTHQHQRTTTIPLPKKPAPAPSPITPLSHATVRSATAPQRPSQLPSQSQSQSQPQTAQPQSQPQNTPYTPSYKRKPPYAQSSPRVIEPTPDIRLPPKYKPAARRVTAIMVALPIVIVFGYELLQRWRGKEVKRKFGDGPVRQG